MTIDASGRTHRSAGVPGGGQFTGGTRPDGPSLTLDPGQSHGPENPVADEASPLRDPSGVKLKPVKLPEVGAGAARGHKVALANPVTLGISRHLEKPLQQFDVYLDGEKVGQIRSVERTESIKASGARYVTRTKHSIGWHHLRAGVDHRTYIERSRVAAVLELVNTVLAEQKTAR